MSPTSYQTAPPRDALTILVENDNGLQGHINAQTSITSSSPSRENGTFRLPHNKGIMCGGGMQNLLALVVPHRGALSVCEHDRKGVHPAARTGFNRDAD
jgi:hypothetical protein